MNSKIHHELASKSAPILAHQKVAAFGKEYLEQGEHVLKVLGALGNALQARRDYRSANHPKARDAMERAERLVGKWLTDCLEGSNGACLVHAVADGMSGRKRNPLLCASRCRLNGKRTKQSSAQGPHQKSSLS